MMRGDFGCATRIRAISRSNLDAQGIGMFGLIAESVLKSLMMKCASYLISRLSTVVLVVSCQTRIWKTGDYEISEAEP